MTWSILAHDPATGEYGVAVATRFFAVGALCPHGDGRFGVLATQALVNPLYGGRGLRLLADGFSASGIVAMLTGADPGASVRQLHVMDARGAVSAHTGKDCVDWCGHISGTHVSVAGNMLAGPKVISATRDACLASLHLPMAERLMTALEAGEREGGDKRGKQSASVRVWRGEEHCMLDFRTDDHADPLAELRRLYAAAHERYIGFSGALATRANPAGITNRAEIDAMIAAAAEKRKA